MKFVRIGKNVILVVLVVLLAVAIPSAPVRAVEVITLSVSQASIGQPVTITGQGFFASTTEVRGVHIIFSHVNPGGTIDYQTEVHEIVKTVTLSSSGQFSTSFNIPGTLTGGSAPEDVTYGTYYVFVTYYYPDRTVNKDGISVLAIKPITVIPGMIFLTPSTGTIGSRVEIDGLGFSPQETISIYFDGSPLAIVGGDIASDNDGEFDDTIINIPESAGGIRTVSVVGDSSGVEAEADFTVMPSITIDPDRGPSSTVVSVEGSGFISGHLVLVTFSDLQVASTPVGTNGSFTATFTVPVPTLGSHEVKAIDSSSSTNQAVASFTIETGGSISPETSESSPGHVGQQLTVNGTGFTGGAQLIIGYDGVQIDTGTVAANGSFTATITVPAGTGGEHTIVVTDSVHAKEFSFYMESTPPSYPRPLKPEMNIKADPEAYFDWEDVTDPSGLTYQLQVATSQDFAASSIVLEVTDLTSSEYTIPKENRLQAVTAEAPYYWHVRAVDRASNASEWSGTGTFSVGSSFGLSQTVIYIIIGAGALLLAVFGFWLGRKTAYF